MDKIDKLVSLLKKLFNAKFFGKVVISVESGKIVNVNVAENLSEFK